ncbi:MAG: enoyl-CoA hydratase/isomerase family protein [Deltaproteobacteria bacterium]|nr:enoyl-CoA hydratase/isomerase family protein [Deltaproteobacteria bacterium]
MSTPETLRVETRGAVVRLTLDREKVLNALSSAVLAELGRAIDAHAQNARVLVLTGAGRAFVAGADISEMAELDPFAASRFSRLGHEVLGKLERLSAITIAEINGFALGGGLELALACDFAIASEKAKLGQPEVGLGVTPGFGGTTRLTRRVGRARAIQMLATAETIGAAEALRIGLVNEVHAPEALRARVDELADKIASNAPIAVALAKRSVHHGADLDLAAANAYEQEVFGLCFSTKDQKEGMRAFLAKTKPNWAGE